MRICNTALLRLTTLALATLLVASVPATAIAWTTLYVINNGVDSATCGADRDHACRSISQAMDNASDGDVIMVGAGRYGDLNGDGNFTGPGDEHASAGGRCVVCITKALRIYSYQGTGATVIEGSPSYASVVSIDHDGVVFGATDHGFTLSGGEGNGLLVTLGSVKSGITVAGNVDLHDTTGFVVNGWDSKECPPEFCNHTATVLLSGNTALNNGTGFEVTSLWDSGPGKIVLRDNQALGAGTGFFVSTGAVISFEITSNIVSLNHNVASRCGVGFAALNPGSVVNNVASDNSEAGFKLAPDVATGSHVGTVFQGNVATGNAGPGVIVTYQTPDLQSIGSFAAFTHNDFYGNDRNRPAPSGPSAHCGVLNLGLGAVGPLFPPPVPTVTLQAAGNFWGSAKGPQSTGPEDTAGGACDKNTGVTNVKPFSPTWFSFVPLPW